MTLSSRERLSRTLNRQPVDRVPISLYEFDGFYDSWIHDYPEYVAILEYALGKTDKMHIWRPGSSVPTLFYGRVEEEILDLVLATTRKVVQREINTQRDVILDVLRQAIAKTIDRERIRVRINPSDYDFVHAHKSDIVSTVDGVKDLVIEGDESVSRGGAVVDSDYGTIDARIERRFEAVEKALRRQRGGQEGAITRDQSDHREKNRAN